MASQKSKKENDIEIREAVEADDERRQLSIYLAVAVGTFAAISAISGGTAVIALRALSRFRPDIGGYWMSCLPFIFPGISGVAVAFKRERTALSIHVGVLIAGFLGGGSCYGYSVDPVFFNNDNCTDIYRVGECNRPGLLYLYIIAGGVATGISLFGLMLSFCACNNVSKRLKIKLAHEEILHYQEEERKRQERMQAKRSQGFSSSAKPTTIITEKAPIGNDVISPATNGMKISSVSGDMNKPADNVTTRL